MIEHARKAGDEHIDQRLHLTVADASLSADEEVQLPRLDLVPDGVQNPVRAVG